MGAELEKGALLRVDLVDPAGGLQLFQLAVDGGQPHRAALPAQVLRQLVGGEGLLRPLLQTAEDGLMLFCSICHNMPRQK